MKTTLLASIASVIPMAFMSADVCEVVSIEGADGKPVRVNKSDYDADQAEGGAKSMTLHKEQPDQSVAGQVVIPPPAGVTIPPAPAAPNFVPATDAAGQPLPVGAPVPPTTPAPNAKLVMKEGRKYYVVDTTGAKITGTDGIDEAGYASEADAIAAINALPH